MLKDHVLDSIETIATYFDHTPSVRMANPAYVQLERVTKALAAACEVDYEAELARAIDVLLTGGPEADDDGDARDPDREDFCRGT